MSNIENPPDLPDTHESKQTASETDSASGANERLAAASYDLDYQADTDSSDSLESENDLDVEENGLIQELDQSDLTLKFKELERLKSQNSSLDLPSLTIDFSPPTELDPQPRRVTGKGGDTPEANQNENRDGEKKEPRTIELEPVYERQAPQAQELSEWEKRNSIDSDQSYWQDRPRMSGAEIKELAGKHISDPEELESFNKSVEAFEARAERDGVSELEKETFYGQVGKVLKASETGNEFYNSDQLKSIAGSMMKHAGEPGTVNQGTEPTCTTAALESVLYQKEPNTVGEVVSEAALTGQYVTASGTTIKIPEHNLMPDKYKADTPPEKARSLASHIFQPLTINIKWQNQDSYPGQAEGKLGNLVYEEGHPKDNPGDVQTRIMDHSTDPPSPITEDVFIIDPLRGENDPVIQMPDSRPASAPLMFMDDLPKIYSDLKGREGSLTTVNIDKADNVLKPESKEEFEELLKSAALNKGDNSAPALPMLIGVHANLEPFHTDLQEYSSKDKSKEESDAESAIHAHHAVAIFDYDPESKMVTLENQWGAKADHTGDADDKEKIHIDDLYRTFTGLSKEERKEIADKTPEKEPTPDELIDSQKEFVEEIAQDQDQDPEKVWQERRELHRRLSHFGREEEANAQRDILINDFEKLTEGKDLEEQTRLASDMVHTLNSGGDHDLAKGIVQKVDKHFIDTMESMPEEERLSQLEGVLQLHKSIDDDNSGKELLADYLEKEIGPNSGLDIADSKDRRKILDTLHFARRNGHKELAGEKFQELTEDLAEREAGGKINPKDTLGVKADLIYTAKHMGHPDIAESYAQDLEREYTEMKKDVTTADEFEADPISDIRYALTTHYADTRQPEKLASLTDDYMRYHMELRMEDGEPLGENHKGLIGPYDHFADDLKRAGATDKAIEYTTRGLELAKQFEPDRADRIASDLALLHYHNGDSQKAEKLIAEHNLPAWMFRRYKK